MEAVQSIDMAPFPFDMLPAEIRNAVYRDIVSYDKIIVMTKPRNRKKADLSSFITSRFSYCFHFESSGQEYLCMLVHHLIHSARVVRVNVVDYNFAHFQSFLKKLQGENALSRFLSTKGSISSRDPAFAYAKFARNYFTVNLRFTKRFQNDDTRLLRWLNFATQMQKKAGHICVHYNVAKVEPSKAMDRYTGDMVFDPNDIHTGQMVFLNKALQRKFAPRVNSPALREQNEEHAVDADNRYVEVATSAFGRRPVLMPSSRFGKGVDESGEPGADPGAEEEDEDESVSELRGEDSLDEDGNDEYTRALEEWWQNYKLENPL